MLHPRHKLNYFKNAGWEEEWVTMAEHLIWNEFLRVYAGAGSGLRAEDHDNDNGEELTKKQVHL